MKNIVFVIGTFICSTMQSQVGINTQTPHLKSVLDVVSKDNNTGVLFPRITTAQRNAINPITTDPAVAGLWIYNTDVNCYEFWNRTQWVSICDNATDVPPLSDVKILSYEDDPTFTFATTLFEEFFNSFDNFGTFPSSTIRTDGSSLVPEKVSRTAFSSINFQDYDIIGVSYRPSVDLTASEVTALVTFANTPGKHLYFFTEGFNQTNKRSLLSQLIGDVTIVSADFVASVGADGNSNATAPCFFITADPANAPFVSGPFGTLQASLHRFVDHAATSNSFSNAKLATSTNVQIIAADGLVAGIPQSTSKVGVFKVKNKNVFIIADGAPFFGGTSNSGPACMTPSSVGGTRGRKPIKCDASSTNGDNSGVAILMSNIIAWSLKNL